MSGFIGTGDEWRITDYYSPAPDPPTPLGRHHILSPTCGARVSPLQLGGMSLGTKWSGWMGGVTKEDAFALLDSFHESGGNWIDTSVNYQDGQSEEFIGDWVQARGNRDEMFIATKYTHAFRNAELGKGHKVSNLMGNSRKTLRASVERSLASLKTSYIDLLYVHLWDWSCSFEEVMDSLHMLVEQGKVLYLGISDTPAWIVSACNTYAKAHGKTPFCAYQGRWNVMVRDLESEIVPMCRQFGMAICPWDALSAGRIRTKEAVAELEKEGGQGTRPVFGHGDAEKQDKAVEALVKVAGQLGGQVTVQQVALAYLMAKAPYVYPIIGGKKVEYLKSNIGALDLRLTEDHIKIIETANPYDPGFPSNFVGMDPRVTRTVPPPQQATAQVHLHADGKYFTAA